MEGSDEEQVEEVNNQRGRIAAGLKNERSKSKSKSLNRGASKKAASRYDAKTNESFDDIKMSIVNVDGELN